MLQKLDHQNIVKYDLCGLHHDILYFTMELIDAGSLKEVLNGSVAWRDAVDVGIQVCDAIEHAHSNGVVHRDLKPANLFLSADGQVKVGDFGIALDVDRNRLTAEGLTVGTRRYMAPEQITADEIGPQADLYSLGCILFEMLAGRVPFDGDSDFAIIEQHLEVAPPKLQDINPLCPPALSGLIERMLAKAPSDRPASADDGYAKTAATKWQAGCAALQCPARHTDTVGCVPDLPNVLARNLTVSSAWRHERIRSDTSRIPMSSWKRLGD